MTDKKNSVIEHFRELRHRLLSGLKALVICLVICLFFVDEIHQFLLAPLSDAMGERADKQVIFTGLTEGFFTHVKLALFAGFLLAFPIIAFQSYGFISPALYAKEKRIIRPFLLISPLLFFAGAALAYYGVMPLAWKFFLSFEHSGQGVDIALQARISEYLSLVMNLVVAFAMSFQLPIILTLLVRFDIITVDWLRNKRRYALIIMFVMAAIITPPDVVSQIALGIPLFLLYELSIILGRYVKQSSQV